MLSYSLLDIMLLHLLTWFASYAASKSKCREHDHQPVQQANIHPVPKGTMAVLLHQKSARRMGRRSTHPVGNTILDLARAFLTVQSQCNL